MLVKPYGDTLNDGAIQLSFTLPIPDSARARESAKSLVLKLGFETCEIVHAKPLSEGFTFFVAYAYTGLGIDPETIQAEDATETLMDFQTINSFIKEHIGRKVIMVGACTGSDAHTVGIDAIMNMKGCNHHFGLERYPMVISHNLGAQVDNADLVDYAEKINADAILVSKIITQKDIHIQSMQALMGLLEERGLRDKFIVIVGGPRISHKLALELGFDAGFGQGTYAEHAATYIVERLAEKEINH